MKNISVLVPVYGVEKYIEKFAFSLFSNTIASQCEFIFVNDKTKDNSITILNNVIKHFPELDIKIIEHEINKGAAAARNTGLKNATCDYVIFADSDDWVEPDYLEILYNTAITTNSDIVICGYITELKNKSVKRFHTFNKRNYDPLKDILYDRIPGYLWCKLIKRSLITENNFYFCEGLNMLEDVNFSSRLFYKAKKIKLIKKYLYHYRIDNPNSIVTTKSINYYRESIENFISIYEYLNQNEIYSEYKKEVIYRINVIKLEFLRRHFFNRTSIYKILSSNDFIFIKENSKYFKIKKMIFALLLEKKCFFIADLLCSLWGVIKKDIRESFDVDDRKLNFFLKFDAY